MDSQSAWIHPQPKSCSPVAGALFLRNVLALQRIAKLHADGCVSQRMTVQVYAKERKDVKFMQEVLHTMVANNVFPTSATADIVFR